MRKTLLRNFTATGIEKEGIIVKKTTKAESLTDLMNEMQGTLEDAAKDLLQPRPEAIAQLLKKALR
jgi:hypothetical protein